MKQTTLRTASLLLALLTASGFVSCGTEGGSTSSDDTTASGNTGAETTAPVEQIARENTPDTLPALDFGGKSVRIAYRGDETTRVVECEGEETGDVVSDAIFARNRSVEERLNVKLEWIPGDADHEKFMANIRTVLLAGDDAYDIIDAIQWRVVPQANEGMYYDLSDAPYLDFDQPWWSNDYMDAVSVSPDVRYLLSGDISVWQTRHMSCMYFNKKIFESNFGDPNALYDTVLDGKWTYDLLNKYVEDVYQDLNNNSTVDDGDIIGIGSTPVSQTDHFTYTAGLKLTSRDKNGNPALLADQSRNVKIIETLYHLYYENPGTLIMPNAAAMDNELVKLFTDGMMLFYPNRFYHTDFFRDMTDPYGMIPFPKLDESQEKYLALVHDSTTLWGIPITCQSIDMQCAVLEAMCAENYRTVTPAYYEVALKVKYTQDDASVRIIDMIHENVTTDFLYANNYSLTKDAQIGTIGRKLMGANGAASTDYMSTYDAAKAAVEADIKKLIEVAEDAK